MKKEHCTPCDYWKPGTGLNKKYGTINFTNNPGEAFIANFNCSIPYQASNTPEAQLLHFHTEPELWAELSNFDSCSTEVLPFQIENFPTDTLLAITEILKNAYDEIAQTINNLDQFENLKVVGSNYMNQPLDDKDVDASDLLSEAIVDGLWGDMCKFITQLTYIAGLAKLENRNITKEYADYLAKTRAITKTK